MDFDKIIKTLVGNMGQQQGQGQGQGQLKSANGQQQQQQQQQPQQSGLGGLLGNYNSVVNPDGTFHDTAVQSGNASNFEGGLSGATKGATIGSAAGPYGALAGAIIGGVAGVTKARKARKKARNEHNKRIGAAKNQQIADSHKIFSQLQGSLK